MTNGELVVGDTICCKGIKVTIGEILSQEFFEALNENRKDEYIIQFKDTKGVYRSWHSGIDGGTIIRNEINNNK